MSSIVALTEFRHRVCVYCASSNACDPRYHEVARQLGGLLADAGCMLVYGGGRAGSTGALADGALARGGRRAGKGVADHGELWQWARTGTPGRRAMLCSGAI